MIFLLRTFKGFATDGDFKIETKKLHDLLESSGKEAIKHLHLTAKYDQPYYNQANVRNEVMVFTV